MALAPTPTAVELAPVATAKSPTAVPPSEAVAALPTATEWVATAPWPMAIVPAPSDWALSPIAIEEGPLATLFEAAGEAVDAARRGRVAESRAADAAGGRLEADG